MAKVYSDFISVLSGGQQSGLNPLLLTKDQFAFGLNLSLRGGYAHTRPPIVKINLNYLGRTDLQAIVEGGYFQGAGYYRPDYGTESLIAQISGRLLLFTQAGTGWNVTDIGVPGDPNNATTPQVWMWQAERWMIINDGSGALPIFYDGVSSRRSYGPSQELGVTANDFIPPIIGGTVDLTLTAPYAGPFNVPVLLNGAFYEPISFKITSTNFNAVLTNLSSAPGATVSAMTGSNPTPILAVPTTAGVFAVESALSIGEGFIPIGDETQIFTLFSPYLGAIGATLSITGSAGFSNGKTLTWKVKSVSGNTVTCTNASQIGSSSPLLPGQTANNGFDYPVGTIAKFNGSSAPSFVVATLAADFIVPSVGSMVPITTTNNYTGADNQIVFIDGDEYSIIYTPPAAPSEIITVLNLTDTTNNPEPQYPTSIAAPQQILSVPELPAGRMGSYGMGRNWFCLTDGISYEAGDIVGGSSGTQAYNFRDSVLKTTENDFLSGGGTFRLPGAGDQITAMVFPPILDRSLGQGELQIFTGVSCFSNTSPVDRTLWESLTSPIQTESLKDNGALAQNSTVLINSDTFFRSFVGYGSLVLARRDFGGWGNKSISNEMQRPLLQDNQSLLQFGSADSFDNRFVSTCAPNLIGAGVFHVGLCILNFDLISSLRTNLPPAWEGVWTGINTMQVVTGRVSGTQRNFSFTYNLTTNHIELWELLGESSAIEAGIYQDNNDTPILSVFETAALFNKDIKPLTELIELIDGEMYLSGVTGTVGVKVFYRPDFYPCWVLWNEFNLCEDDDNSTGDGNKQPGYWMRIGLGQPEPENADDLNDAVSNDLGSPANNRPLRYGYFHQFRVEITGYAVFRGLMIKGSQVPETALATVIELDSPCQLIDCVVPNDLQIYSLQGFIPLPPSNNPPLPWKFRNVQVFYPGVCTTGTPSVSIVLPSWITLDATNNQFIGKANVFGGQTQAQADGFAQTSLNNFVSQNVALGNITCSALVPVPNELWYKYVEGSGTTTADFSVARNNGQGVTGWIAGPNADGAVVISTDGVNSTTNSTWSAGDFSYSLWVKPSGTPGTFYPLVEVQYFSSGSQHGMDLAINSSNQLVFMAKYPTVLLTGSFVTPAAWQMVSFTYNHTSGLMTLYLNGAPAGNASLVSAFTDGLIYIGGDGAFGRAIFLGDIADTRIWNSELSAADIAAIFAAGAQ